MIKFNCKNSKMKMKMEFSSQIYRITCIIWLAPQKTLFSDNWESRTSAWWSGKGPIFIIIFDYWMIAYCVSFRKVDKNTTLFLLKTIIFEIQITYEKPHIGNKILKLHFSSNIIFERYVFFPFVRVDPCYIEWLQFHFWITRITYMKKITQNSFLLFLTPLFWLKK